MGGLGAQDGERHGGGDEGMGDDLSNQGTISFRLRGNQGSLEQSGIRVDVIRVPGGVLDITINGPFGREFRHRTDAAYVAPEIHIAVTWKRPIVKFYVDGKMVSEQSMTTH